MFGIFLLFHQDEELSGASEIITDVVSVKLTDFVLFIHPHLVILD